MPASFSAAAAALAYGAPGSRLPKLKKTTLTFWLESRRVADFVRADAPTAKDANVRKFIEVRHGDLMRLHAAHGEAGHCAMRLIAERAKIRVDVLDQVVE